MTQRRLKRFERTEGAMPLRLTQRDIDILHHVARFRFLSSRQVATLVGEGGRVSRRLQSLFHNGYLDRPRAQLLYYGEAGSERMIYGLGQEGAKLLGRIEESDIGDLRWSQKNREAKQLFIKHTVAVADVLIGLDRICGSQTRLRFVDESELLQHAPEATQRMRNPTKVSARVTFKGRGYEMALVPDAAFSLVETEGEARRQYNFFLELDTGTMPLVRKAASLTGPNRQTSVFAKLLTYGQAHADRQMRERLGWSSFKVLVVTTAARKAALDAIVSEQLDAASRRIIEVTTPDALAHIVAAITMHNVSQPD